MAPADPRNPRFLGVYGLEKVSGIIHHDVHGGALHDPARYFAAAHGKDHIDNDDDGSNKSNNINNNELTSMYLLVQYVRDEWQGTDLLPISTHPTVTWVRM